MTLGFFLLLIFILYLIDKHNRWRQAIKITIGLVVFGLLGIGGLFGWQKYQEMQVERRQEAAAAEEARETAKKQAELDKACGDWESKHRLGGPLDKFKPDSAKQEFVLDPPEGCVGAIETDYKNTEAAWVALNTARPRAFGNAGIVPDSTLLFGCNSSTLITTVYRGNRVKVLEHKSDKWRVQLDDGRVGCLIAEDDVQLDK